MRRKDLFDDKAMAKYRPEKEQQDSPTTATATARKHTSFTCASEKTDGLFVKKSSSWLFSRYLGRSSGRLSVRPASWLSFFILLSVKYKEGKENLCLQWSFSSPVSKSPKPIHIAWYISQVEDEDEEQDRDDTQLLLLFARSLLRWWKGDRAKTTDQAKGWWRWWYAADKRQKRAAKAREKYNKKTDSPPLQQSVRVWLVSRLKRG